MDAAKELAAAKEDFKDYCFRKHVEEHLRIMKKLQEAIYGNVEKLPFEVDREQYEWEIIYQGVMKKERK